MLLVSYLRVSTSRQQISGLGLDAQREAIEKYRQSVHGTVLGEYEEQESGRRNDRPKLMLALSHAKRTHAKLVIARLDRLSRNVAFLSALLEAKVDFVCCDMPSANKLTLHILAAVAQNEAELASIRTKAALAQAKSRGVLLGSARPGHWAGREHIRVAASAKGAASAAMVIHQNAVEAYADLLPIIVKLRERQHTLREIAAKLNEQGYRTRRDKPWTNVQVGRVLRLTA